MGAISNIELKAKLEETLSTLACKKNNMLCLGKNVESINKQMKAVYNWWSILDICLLSESEINCIVNDIGTICNFSLPKRQYDYFYNRS